MNNRSPSEGYVISCLRDASIAKMLPVWSTTGRTLTNVVIFQFYFAILLIDFSD